MALHVSFALTAPLWLDSKDLRTALRKARALEVSPGRL